MIFSRGSLINLCSACGIVVPENSALASKGIIAALADGVGGSGGGRDAAEFSVRGLLADYYATPDTWAIPHALDKVLQPILRALGLTEAVR